MAHPDLGFFYSQVDAGQERPFVSQIFGPQPTFISDHTEETRGFLQASVTPFEDLNLVAGGRYDHFNQFGDVWTYRFAGSYMIEQNRHDVARECRDRVQSAEQPGQDFREQFRPGAGEESAAGTSESSSVFGKDGCTIGATYFHNDLSNVIGFNGLFETLNLGAARTQGVETEMQRDAD